MRRTFNVLFCLALAALCLCFPSPARAAEQHCTPAPLALAALQQHPLFVRSRELAGPEAARTVQWLGARRVEGDGPIDTVALVFRRDGHVSVLLGWDGFTCGEVVVLPMQVYQLLEAVDGTGA